MEPISESRWHLNLYHDLGFVAICQCVDWLLLRLVILIFGVPVPDPQSLTWVYRKTHTRSELEHAAERIKVIFSAHPSCQYVTTCVFSRVLCREHKYRKNSINPLGIKSISSGSRTAPQLLVPKCEHIGSFHHGARHLLAVL